MRRKDREVTDRAIIDQVIQSCDCCRLGFCDRGEAYIVPLNFGYDPKNKIFYFHSAAVGRKMELIRKTERVSFEMDTNHALKEGCRASDYSFRYISVMGTGLIQILEQPEEKRKGLSSIMEHYTGKSDWCISESELLSVAVFQVTEESLSCKCHA